MAVFHGKLLDGFFIRPFYKMMLGKSIELKVGRRLIMFFVLSVVSIFTLYHSKKWTNYWREYFFNFESAHCTPSTPTAWVMWGQTKHLGPVRPYRFFFITGPLVQISFQIYIQICFLLSGGHGLSVFNVLCYVMLCYVMWVHGLSVCDMLCYVQDMESVDTEYHNSLRWIKENDPAELELAFQVSLPCTLYIVQCTLYSV